VDQVWKVAGYQQVVLKNSYGQQKYHISQPIRRTVIFSLEILDKNNDECI
jgi:hypothetical protein